MIEEFDNEIDSILRKTARNQTAFATVNLPSNHLDADEIAAFAENALPEKARSNYIAHFADCDRCRKTLSNVIALNSELQSEIIHAEEPKLLAATAKIPWYRRFFTVPTLALTMGAFVLFFAGIGIFSILQNDSMSPQVSQVSEKQPGGKGMSSDGDSSPPENYSGTVSNQSAANSNMMSANTTANISNSANASAPALTAANSNSAINRDEPEKTAKTEENQSSKLLSSDSKLSANEQSDAAVVPPAPPPPPPVEATKEDSDKNAQETPETEDRIRQQNPPKPSVARAAPSVGTQKPEAKRKAESAETTTVNGKNFKRSNNVWVDSAYRGQATTNVSRGTNEYKNLDSDLRGIVENLGGTVVIVWKERAYRIQ